MKLSITNKLLISLLAIINTMPSIRSAHTMVEATTQNPYAEPSFSVSHELTEKLPSLVPKQSPAAVALHAQEQEEIKEKASKTQLLTIFLDDSEASPNEKTIGVTEKFLNAIYDQAGPIVASSSLLYNLLEGPYSKKRPDIAALFKKDFNNGDQWILREIKNSFSKKILEPGGNLTQKTIQGNSVIMIPRQYLIKNQLTVDELGLDINNASLFTHENTLATLQNINTNYSRLSPDDWLFLSQQTGTLFVNALISNRIFNKEKHHIQWVIYLNGHGEYGKTIADIKIPTDFVKVLDFFETKINVALFIYIACSAAGLNSAAIYGELTKAGSVKEYSFPIITESVTDAFTSWTGPYDKNKLLAVSSQFNTFIASQNKDQQLVLSSNFNAFLEQFIADNERIRKLPSKHQEPLEHPYRKSLTFIMPYLALYENEEIHKHEYKNNPLYHNNSPDLYPGNLPLIRYPHSPAWFPVIDNKTSIIPITKTMALTRTKPLEISTTKKGSVLQKVLLDTHYLPFNIIIKHYSYPKFIITLPGDTLVHIKKIITQDPFVSIIQHLPSMMNVDFNQPFYTGNKYIHIKEGQDTISTYKDIILDYTNKALYFSDTGNTQYLINPQGMYLCPFDYLNAFSNILSDYQQLSTDHALKRYRFQKIPKMLKKRN